MRKNEKSAFADFLQDEATKYRVTLTTPEIELWFETFEKASIEEFRSAWVQHKRDEKLGGMFPKIPWMQRALHATGDVAGKHDHRCVWNGSGVRCKYPVGAFDLGKTDGYCIFHRRTMSGIPAQAICDESQDATPEEYLERAKRLMYGDGPPASVLKLREQIARRAAGGNVGVLSATLLAGFGNRNEVDDQLDRVNRELAIESARGAE